MSELIAMQKDLGLGHKGDILLTTQKRFDSNQEAIAKDIIDKDYAEKIIHRYNAFEDGGIVYELKEAAECLTKQPGCVSCRIELEAAIAKCSTDT